MALATPDWTRVPDALPFLAPHEQFSAAIVRGWQYLVAVVAELNWISVSEADRLIKQGVSLASICGWCGIACLSAALFVLTREASESMRHEIGGEGGEPRHGGRQTSEGLRGIAAGLSQAQFSITNLLLDPSAQPVAEPLRDISHQLQQVSIAVQGIQSAGQATRLPAKREA